jgi:hypothetical protein
VLQSFEAEVSGDERAQQIDKVLVHEHDYHRNFVMTLDGRGAPPVELPPLVRP